MKENESSPLAFEFPPPDSYFLREHHADTTIDNETIVYNDSLLAKLEAVVNEAGTAAAQSSSRTQSLNHPLHILRDVGRHSFLSSHSLDVGGGGGSGAQKVEIFSSAAKDEPTTASSKPFVDSISTNTRDSPSTTVIETSDPPPPKGGPQQSVSSDDDVANDDEGDGRPSSVSAAVVHPNQNGCSTTDGPPPKRCGATSHHLHVPSSNHQSQGSQQQQQLQKQEQLQEQQQQEEGRQDYSRDAEDIPMYYQRTEFITQSRMEIDHRRRYPYNSIHHQYYQRHHHKRPRLPPLPLPPDVAKTDSSKATTRRGPVSHLPSFDRQHLYARRDYSSPTYLQDFVLTRRGSINDKVWDTSLSPRKTVLPFAAAIEVWQQQQQQQGGSRSSEGSSSSSLSATELPSSVSLSRFLPEPSPGHQIYPPKEPGPLYGVRRPRFTHRHALYDVPFYGIENVEISSSRYQLLTQVNSTRELQEDDRDPLQITRRVGGDGGDTVAGAGGVEVGEGRRGGAVRLSDHREHVWSIAHEQEYGPDVGTGGGEENGLLRGRIKRTLRIVPVVPSTVGSASASGSGSGSGSGLGSKSTSATDATSKSRSETSGGGRERAGGATELRIEVDHHHGPDIELTKLRTASSSSTSRITTNNHNYNSRFHASLPPPPRSSSNYHRSLPLASRPVSEGVYSLNTYESTLEDPNYFAPERPLTRWGKLMMVVRRHWRTWLCVGLILVAAVVVPVVLSKKLGGGGADGGIGDGGGGGEDIEFEFEGDGGEIEPTTTTGGERKVVTNTKIVPATTPSRSVKATHTVTFSSATQMSKTTPTASSSSAVLATHTPRDTQT